MIVIIDLPNDDDEPIGEQIYVQTETGYLDSQWCEILATLSYDEWMHRK